MATGRPVVAVPVGGIPEIVRDGATGLLAQRADADALAVAMRAVMGLPGAALTHLGQAMTEAMQRLQLAIAKAAASTAPFC